MSTLYHIAPCCFVFLFLPFTYIELPKIMSDPTVKINVPLLLLSASIAFGEIGHMGIGWVASAPAVSQSRAASEGSM